MLTRIPFGSIFRNFTVHRDRDEPVARTILELDDLVTRPKPSVISFFDGLTRPGRSDRLSDGNYGRIPIDSPYVLWHRMGSQ